MSFRLCAGLGVLVVPAIAAGPGRTFPVAFQADTGALVERVVEAAGGAEVLSRYPALEWTGEAMVHVAGRDLAIAGTWKIEPPEKAVVETRLAGQPPEAARTLVINGRQGWSIANGQRSPLPAEMLDNERDQFYLYSLMRLLPLRDAAARLERLPRSTDGLEGLRVSRPDRPVVDLFFDAGARLRHLTLVTLDPVTKTRRRQHVRLEGDIASRGMRWFKRLTITWDTEPYFELTVSGLEVMEKLVDPRLVASPGVTHRP